MDMTTQDKISLLKVGDEAPDLSQLHGIDVGKKVEEELPAFAGYLLGREIPSDRRDGRFGVRAWQDPELLEEARELSPTQQAIEAIVSWRNGFDRNNTTADTSKPVFSGSATELLEELTGHLTPGSPLSKALNRGVVGRALKTLERGECGWVESYKTKHSRGYRIAWPEEGDR